MNINVHRVAWIDQRRTNIGGGVTVLEQVFRDANGDKIGEITLFSDPHRSIKTSEEV